MPTDAELLAAHEAIFNEAVRTGDFEPLVSLFAPDAVLAFEGVPAGPFRGRDAIRAAYAAQPPDDTLTVLETWVEDGIAREVFSWSADAGRRSGVMRLVLADGAIRSLVVSFG